MRRSRAFSLVELLIAGVIMAILAVAIMTAMWVAWGGFHQTQDYVAGRQEMEYAFQVLGRQMSNISLGMPNNRSEVGGFPNAFKGTGEPYPVMALMGATNEAWGGPVTLADFPPSAAIPTTADAISSRMVKTPVSSSTPHIYGGNAIYYAWAVPVFDFDGNNRIAIKLENPTGTEEIFEGDPPVRFNFVHPNFSQFINTKKFRINGQREWSFVAGPGLDMRSWVTFPTVRLNFLITAIDNTSMSLQVAPRSEIGTATGEKLHTYLATYQDLYAIQACRVYVNERQELVQEIFGSDYRNSDANWRDVLARGIVGLYFRFDQENHLLTMYLAAIGQEESENTRFAGNPSAWPEEAQGFTAEDLRRRIIVQSMTWRIRN